MGILFFRLWQWTWGFPQSLLGFLLRMSLGDRPHGHYHGCVVTHWEKGGSMSLGMYLFLGTGADDSVRVHEFGHAVQSAILGPLYLPVIGIPSWLWCNLSVFRKLRKEKEIPYCSFYPESTANWLGTKVTGEPSPSE